VRKASMQSKVKQYPFLFHSKVARRQTFLTYIWKDIKRD